MTYVTVPVVNTQEGYDRALRRLDEIFDAPAGTPESDEADMLVTLINAYEQKAFKIEPAHPVDVIKFVMEQRGLKQNDLADAMGGKNRVSEVLNGKRSLSKEMIINLNRQFHIPVEALMTVV